MRVLPKCDVFMFYTILTQCARPIRGAALQEAVGIGVASPALVRRGSVAKGVLETHDGEQVKDLVLARLVPVPDYVNFRLKQLINPKFVG